MLLNGSSLTSIVGRGDVISNTTTMSPSDNFRLTDIQQKIDAYVNGAKYQDAVNMVVEIIDSIETTDDRKLFASALKALIAFLSSPLSVRNDMSTRFCNAFFVIYRKQLDNLLKSKHFTELERTLFGLDLFLYRCQNVRSTSRSWSSQLDYMKVLLLSLCSKLDLARNRQGFQQDSRQAGLRAAVCFNLILINFENAVIQQHDKQSHDHSETLDNSIIFLYVEAANIFHYLTSLHRTLENDVISIVTSEKKLNEYVSKLFSSQVSFLPSNTSLTKQSYIGSIKHVTSTNSQIYSLDAVRKFVPVAIYSQVNDIDAIVWLLMKYWNPVDEYRVEELFPSFRVSPVVFAKTSTDNLSDMDLMAFIHLSVTCAAFRGVNCNLPASLCNYLTTDGQRLFWTAVNALARNAENSSQRLAIQNTINLTRLIRKGGLDIRLIDATAKMFQKLTVDGQTDEMRDAAKLFADVYWKEIVLIIDSGSPNSTNSGMFAIDQMPFLHSEQRTLIYQRAKQFICSGVVATQQEPESTWNASILSPSTFLKQNGSTLPFERSAHASVSVSQARSVDDVINSSIATSLFTDMQSAVAENTRLLKDLDANYHRLPRQITNEVLDSVEPSRTLLRELIDSQRSFSQKMDDRLDSVVKELKNDLDDLAREIKNLKLFIKENATTTTTPPVPVETAGPRQPDPMAMFYAQQLAVLQHQLAATQPAAQHFGVAMNADALAQQHVIRQAMLAQQQQQQQNVMAGRYVAAVTPPQMGGVPRPLFDGPLMSDHAFNQSQSAHVVPAVVPVTRLRPALPTTTTNVAPVVERKLPESVSAALSGTTAPKLTASLDAAATSTPKVLSLVASSTAPKTPESIMNTSTTAAQRSGHKDSETSVDTSGIDPHFEPVVPLPDEVEQVTGEEGLEVLMEERCRVYRYVESEGGGDWRERGTGCLKVLKEPDTGRVRLLMRREQIHKICLNHYINSNMKLTKKTDLCWMWCAMEIESDENNQLIPMKIAIRFKTIDLVARFCQLFEAAKCAAPSPNTSLQTLEQDEENNTTSATFSFKPKAPVTDAVKDIPRIDKDNLFGSAKSSTAASPFSFGFSSSKPLATSTPQSNYIAGGSAKNGQIAPPKFEIAAPKFEIAAPKFEIAKAATPVSQAGPFTFGGFSFSQKPLVTSTPATTTVDKNKDGLKPDKNQPEVDKKPSPFAAFSFGKPTDDVTAASALGGTAGSTLINSTPVFGNKESTSSFAALAKQLESKPVLGATNAFGGFVGAGSKVFGGGSVVTKTPTSVNSGCKDDDDDSAGPEDFAPTVDFTPVIPLPQLVTVKTGEEEETILFCQRCKLYRFDPELNEFKERGLGELKILLDPNTEKRRVVMRREQVFKICANFAITSTLDIKPMDKNDKSYTFMVDDFSESVLEKHTFAVRFKTKELADQFRSIVVDAVDAAANGEDVSFNEKESTEPPRSFDQFKPKEGSWTCKNCYVSNGPNIDNCICCNSDRAGNAPQGGGFAGAVPHYVAPTKPDTATASGFSFGFGTSKTIASPVDNTHDHSSRLTFAQVTAGNGDSTNGFKFGQQSTTSTTEQKSSSPHKPFSFGTIATSTTGFSGVNQSKGDEENANVVDDDGYYPTEERDDIHFEPVVQLPQLEIIETGEESEECLYETIDRSKLYIITDTNEFAERGVGKIRILQDRDTGKIRLVMRREQTFKVCLNCYIDETTVFTRRDSKIWMFCGLDFSEETATPQKFTVRFKSEAGAQLFKENVDLAVKKVTPGISPMRAFKQQQTVTTSPLAATMTASSVGSSSPVDFSFKASLSPSTSNNSNYESINNVSGSVTGFSFKSASSTSPSVKQTGFGSLGTTPVSTPVSKPIFGTSASQPSADLRYRLNQIGNSKQIENDNLQRSDSASSLASGVHVVYDAQVNIRPEDEALTEKFHLPKSFYNYRTQPPCDGCQGCEVESEDESATEADQDARGLRSTAEVDKLLNVIFDEKTVTLNNVSGNIVSKFSTGKISIIQDDMAYRIVLRSTDSEEIVFSQIITVECNPEMQRNYKINWSGINEASRPSFRSKYQAQFSNLDQQSKFINEMNNGVELAKQNNVNFDTIVNIQRLAVQPEINALAKMNFPDSDISKNDE